MLFQPIFNPVDANHSPPSMTVFLANPAPGPTNC